MRKSQISFLTAIIFFGIAAMAADDCDDSGVCRLPGSSVDTQKSGVLSPVGKNSIKKIKQSPRLSTLNGKNIAVVGGSFMASVTHPEML